MGDFRASIKIDFQMGDLRRTADMWINWSPNDDGVDERIVEWFRKVGDEGRALISEHIVDAQLESDRRDTEARERAELARLKEKYDR